MDNFRAALEQERRVFADRRRPRRALIGRQNPRRRRGRRRQTPSPAFYRNKIVVDKAVEEFIKSLREIKFLDSTFYFHLKSEAVLRNSLYEECKKHVGNMKEFLEDYLAKNTFFRLTLASRALEHVELGIGEASNQNLLISSFLEECEKNSIPSSLMRKDYFRVPGTVAINATVHFMGSPQLLLSLLSFVGTFDLSEEVKEKVTVFVRDRSNWLFLGWQDRAKVFSILKWKKMDSVLLQFDMFEDLVFLDPNQDVNKGGLCLTEKDVRLETFLKDRVSKQKMKTFKSEVWFQKFYELPIINFALTPISRQITSIGTLLKENGLRNEVLIYLRTVLHCGALEIIDSNLKESALQSLPLFSFFPNLTSILILLQDLATLKKLDTHFGSKGFQKKDLDVQAVNLSTDVECPVLEKCLLPPLVAVVFTQNEEIADFLIRETLTRKQVMNLEKAFAAEGPRRGLSKDEVKSGMMFLKKVIGRVRRKKRV